MAKDKKRQVAFMIEESRLEYLEKLAEHYSLEHNLEIGYRDLIVQSIKSHLPMPGEKPRSPQGPFADEQLKTGVETE